MEIVADASAFLAVILNESDSVVLKINYRLLALTTVCVMRQETLV